MADPRDLQSVRPILSSGVGEVGLPAPAPRPAAALATAPLPGAQGLTLRAPSGQPAAMVTEDRFRLHDGVREVVAHALTLIGSQQREDALDHPDSLRDAVQLESDPMSQRQADELESEERLSRDERALADLRARESGRVIDRDQQMRSLREQEARIVGRELQGRPPDGPGLPRGDNWVQWLREHGLYQSYVQSTAADEKARESAEREMGRDPTRVLSVPLEREPAQNTARELSTDRSVRDPSELRSLETARVPAPEELRPRSDLARAAEGTIRAPIAELEGTDSFSVRDGGREILEPVLEAPASTPVAEGDQEPARAFQDRGYEALPSGGLEIREQARPPEPPHPAGAPLPPPPGTKPGDLGSLVPAGAGGIEGAEPLRDSERVYGRLRGRDKTVRRVNSVEPYASSDADAQDRQEQGEGRDHPESQDQDDPFP